MEKLKAAIVGCGNISRIHAKALCLNENATVTAVCDIVPERADEKAAELGAKAFYALEDMLEWGDFDVLHICTPHYLHAEMAISAINHGKHVLCEKPAAVFYSDAVKMCEAAEKMGVYLGVCFQNRYNMQSRYIKNLLESGELGAVTAVKGIVSWDRDETYYNADNWHGTLEKEGGGVVINQAIHTIDLMQWFVDREVLEVRGSVSQKRLGGIVETEDTADALITFSGGVRGVFFGTLCYDGNSPVFIEVKCEKGKIVLYDDLTVYRDGGETQRVEFPTLTGEKSYWGSSHRTLIDDFYASVSSGKPFELGGREGIKAVRLVDELYKSGRGEG